MKTKKELVLQQIELQEKIQRLANINIVNCGSCGSVILHEINDKDIECLSCGIVIAQCDCPDFWYNGLENNEEFNND
jgi:predicted RNA-binding Zn-ribbon protein involved in translation (DUF1610 family)